MKDRVPDAIQLEQAAERLRQEAETFDQAKSHVERWFKLRLTMGYASAVLLPAILALSGYILLNANAFSAAVVTSAGAALFVDGLGLFVAFWKVVLNPGNATQLVPLTVIGGGTSTGNGPAALPKSGLQQTPPSGSLGRRS